MQLTPHFSLEELTHSDTAARLGIDNTPAADVIEQLQATAEMMERVREILGAPIVISSGYRCLALNRSLGSKDTSAHVFGRAVDFTCPGFGPPLAVAERLSSRLAVLGFDQLIHEFRRWVHIGRAAGERVPRGELLTIDARGTRAGLLA
jgi:zinc D-Ala-D-Ala carboxypeptidase